MSKYSVTIYSLALIYCGCKALDKSSRRENLSSVALRMRRARASFTCVEHIRTLLFQCSYANLDQADEVRTIIQKATKDVAIESSLRTYEEVWLSKVFELKRYKKARVSSAAMLTGNQEV